MYTRQNKRIIRSLRIIDPACCTRKFTVEWRLEAWYGGGERIPLMRTRASAPRGASWVHYIAGLLRICGKLCYIYVCVLTANTQTLCALFVRATGHEIEREKLESI